MKNNFSHFKLDTTYAVALDKNLEFNINTGGQLSLDDLLNSEQSSITGPDKLSGFTSGSISGKFQKAEHLQSGHSLPW